DFSMREADQAAAQGAADALVAQVIYDARNNCLDRNAVCTQNAETKFTQALNVKAQGGSLGNRLKLGVGVGVENKWKVTLVVPADKTGRFLDSIGTAQRPDPARVTVPAGST